MGWVRLVCKPECSYISSHYATTCEAFDSFEPIHFSLFSDAFKLVNHLQINSIAHNLLIARAPVTSQSSDQLSARVYVWARKSVTGAKVSKDVAFNVAVAELGGQIPMYSKSNSFISRKLFWNFLSLSEMFTLVADEKAFETVTSDLIKSVIQEHLLDVDALHQLRRDVITLFDET